MAPTIRKRNSSLRMSMTEMHIGIAEVELLMRRNLTRTMRGVTMTSIRMVRRAGS